MAKNNNLRDFLTGVANAIRTRKGVAYDIGAQDFEAEILSIPGGSSPEYGADVLTAQVHATSGVSGVHYEGETPEPAASSTFITFTTDLTNYDYLYFCYNGLDAGSGHNSGVHYGTLSAKLYIGSTEYVLFSGSTGYAFPSDHVEIVKKIDVSAVTGTPTLQLALYAESTSTSVHHWANADVNVKHIYVQASS